MSPRSLPEICVVWNLLSKVVTELTFCSWQGSRCISWSVHWEWLRTVCLGLFSCADFELSLSRSLIIIHYSILVLETWDVLDSSGVDGVCVCVSQLLWSQWRTTAKFKMQRVEKGCHVEDQCMCTYKFLLQIVCKFLQFDLSLLVAHSAHRERKHRKP